MSRDVADVGGAAVLASLGRERPAERVRLSDVQEAPVDWYWRDWIPYGAITVVDGDPGVGKTTMVLERIARGTRGELDGPAVPALVISTEDSLEHTIVPRLRVCGADLTLVHAPQDVWDLDPEGGLQALELHVHATGARAVLLDPLVAFLPVDTHKDGEVRRILGPLARLAERRSLAVIAIRHLRKAADGPALYRGGGSIGIVGAARSGLLVARDPGDPSRLVVASTKSNLGPRPASIAWRLVPPYPPGSGPCGVEWIESSPLSADELLAPARGGKVVEAAEWLRSQLQAGPVAVATLRTAAEQAGHSWRTVQRARKAIKVRIVKGLDGPAWEPA